MPRPGMKLVNRGPAGLLHKTDKQSVNASKAGHPWQRARCPP